ncbi:MAG: hypothetical protein HWD85_04305 [Flavobacteriaceae bacterium]|nr:hypothetical protein [Flavobacteriaceae bacterium]
MTNSTNKPNPLFWIIGIVALIWNAMGVFAYLVRAFITEEMIAALPKEQQAEFLVEYPAWYTAAFALAVFCGALGSLLLLLRKKLAYPMFIISAIAAIAQHIYLFMNVKEMDMKMPILIIVFCLFLVWYSKDVISKGYVK